MQSLAVLHALPAAQVDPHAPPQSTSVSVPFLTMSVHVAPAHRPAAQLIERQSLIATQRRPFAQALQVPPPQSTSVSAPFCAMSLQLEPMQVPPRQVAER